MVLNTAASISFSQINSTSYFTNGNLGINTTNPTANLDVAGTINASGLSSLASITTGALSATNVSAGVINSSGLTTGNINFTGSLFQNGVAYVGSQWTSTAGNVSYTSGSVVATNAEFTNAEFTNATINNFSFGTNVTVNNLLASSLNLGISSMYSGSFVASNNVTIATDVTGLAFANANIRSFNASISISLILSAGSSLYGMVNLNGTQNANGWSLYTETIGDDTGVTFTITSSGQIQYTSTNQSNWSNTTFRFNVQQFSATGTYSSLSANTQGSYIMDSIQLNSLTDAVPGVSNGPLYILGGATIEKRLNVNGVVSTGGLSVTNATATNVSTGVVIASTGLTTGTINATGLSSLQNVTATNVSAGTLTASTGITTGTINATGLSSLANATVTNVSTGGLNATGTSVLANVTATNVSTGTLTASTGITAASLYVNTSTRLHNSNASGTNGALLVSGTDSYGQSLYVASTSTMGKRVVITNNGTVGAVFAYDYGSNVPQILTLQGPGGNVGIGTDTPSANLDVVGTIKVSELSALANVTTTNVSTGTLIATTSVTSGLLSATNIVGNSISAGTLSATTITGANLSLSGNLSVAGTLTTVNITSTNILNTNISAGTINATGLSSLTNATATNISTGGLNATGTSILAHTYVTGPGAGVGTNGSLLVSGSDAYGHALYVSSSSAIGKRIGFQQTGTVGSIFAYNYTNGVPQNLALQMPGGSVGIGTESPTYTLDVVGSVRSSVTNNTSYLPTCAFANNSTLAGSAVGSFLVPNITIGSIYPLYFGKSLSVGNSGALTYYYAGSNNSANYLGFENYGKGGGIYLSNNGNVGISTTSPNAQLSVNHDFFISANSGSWNSAVGKGLFMRYSTFGSQDSAYIQSMNRSATTMHPLTIQASTINLSNDSSATSRIFINESGNVGVGTASPGEALDVRGNLRIGNSSQSNYISFYGTSGDEPGTWSHTYIGERIYGDSEKSELLLFKGNDINTSAGPDRIRYLSANHVFDTYTSPLSGTFAGVGTSGTTRMTIDQNGNVGISTTSPAYTLDVSGTGRFTSNLAVIGNVGIGTTSPSGMLHLNNAALFTSTGNLTCTGDVVSFGSLSDRRLKKNIETIRTEKALDIVSKLRAVTFDWKEDIFNEEKRNTSDLGFIAQEVEELIPEAVSEYTQIESGEVYKNIKHERLVPYLLSAIQYLLSKQT